MAGLGVSAGCSDDNPPPTKLDGAVKDTGKTDTTVQPDTNNLWPDLSPDTGQKDLWPSDDKGYGGGAFGCKTDADCFGQKCCPTPWGVKLCAPACTMP